MKSHYLLLSSAAVLCSFQMSYAQWQLNSGNSNQLYTLTALVGSGTATPNATFHVNLNHGGWTALPSSPPPIFKVNYTNPANVDQEYFNVLTNGNCGIGTDAPIDWLHVMHTDNNHGITLDMFSGSSANSTLSFAQNNTKYWNIGMDLSHDQTHNFFITRAGTISPDLFINDIGQVSFGSSVFSNLTTKLQVSGGNFEAVNGSNIIANGGDVIIKNGTLTISGSNGQNSFKVSANGFVRARQILVDLQTIPDYVFHKDYKLMSLGELENYIDKNHHLPNIPSAAEYQEQGAIDITSLQLKMLEKLEELTLYILELKHENEVLKERINSQN